MLLMITSTLLFAAAAFLSVRGITREWFSSSSQGRPGDTSDDHFGLFARLVPQPILRRAAFEFGWSQVRCWWATWTLMLVVIMAVGWLLGILPIAIVLVIVWFFAPNWFLTWRLHRRRMKLRDQLVGAMQMLANSARAGQSLAQGLDSVSRDVAPPLSGELRQMMSEYHLGRPLAEAIDDAKARLQLDSFSMFASTITISLRRGGRVTEALERISRSLRENQRIERKLESETAGGWRVVMILTAFPFVFLAAFYFLHPEGTLLMFQSLIGQVLVILIIALVVASVWWSRRILNRLW